MSTRSIKILFWFVILALVLACGPSWIAAVPPTANPEQVNTFIAQTANAASTQTAAAMPTSSPTATITPTPRNTDTPTPTFTSTVIFVLSSPTKQAPPTLIIISGGGGGSGGSGGSSNSKYACQVLSVSPAQGTSFNPRDDFDTVWHVKNTGTSGWDHNSVDFIYSSGAKIHKVAGYDLSKDVNSGQTIDLGVDMVAPKASGIYSTTWTLRVGSDEFCSVTQTIAVR